MEAPESDFRLVQQGKLLRVVGMSGNRGNSEPPKRGTVKTFSRAARRRMSRLIATLGDEVPIFVTLTYGAEWPPEAATWKRHLDNWLYRLKRKHPEISGVWRLEPQKRGAPHYHLLLYGGRIGKDWLSMSWAEASEDTSPDHVAAGTNVQSIRSSRGAAWYCSKYLTKDVADNLPPEWSLVGRWWGIHNRQKLPVSPKQEMKLSPLVLQNILGFFRFQIDKRLASSVYREFQDTPGGPPQSLLDEASLEKWVVPTTMIQEPDVFFREFSVFIRQRIMDEAETRFSPEDFRKIAPMIRAKLDKELEEIARVA